MRGMSPRKAAESLPSAHVPSGAEAVNQSRQSFNSAMRHTLHAIPGTLSLLYQRLHSASLQTASSRAAPALKYSTARQYAGLP